ncbi:HlyD family efflux transporter periplasmic adaptor subunit [Stappia sp. F7233]|uniref:HlyD family efflux transporter periplasmic adaptor subunit n=1 Tax=Stappia albiluteola TaxID=2758565 RepID=A0A839AG10_9HYPH|nr:HlyD family efflux transporter periplasmic adaptor subunit [Stappia albiluteola]MBA5778065.1 HlyD family efflux transporter periplasmic adaptor subunit [Stappia albiluteola]
MNFRYVIVAVAVLAVGIGGFSYIQRLRSSDAPEGFYRVNGRIEVNRVDVAVKYAGRVAAIEVDEGDIVAKGTFVAQMDASETLAQKASAEAAVSRALQQLSEARATVEIREADLRLAEVNLKRAAGLRVGDTVAQSELDRRQAERDVKAATRDAARAAVGSAEAAVEAAKANVQEISAVLDDMRLIAPVTARVEYRLAEPGEVLGAGGRVLTLLDLSDVYMTVFVPTEYVGRVAYGDEARVVFDAIPAYVFPATVSFISGEAQFTPKYVETEEERQKLMYRVKLRFAPDLLKRYLDYVKAGLTADAYLRVAPQAEWPESLKPNLPEAGSQTPATAGGKG